MPYAYKDLTGQRFGKLVVLRKTDLRRKGKILWICQCDCGNMHQAMSSRLISGHTKSCGCYQREKITEMNLTHGGSHSRLYSIWASMKTRCSNPNYKKFDYYGGRGITVCHEWQESFETFRDWALANGYRDDLTLDRKNGDKGYFPENCQWATWSEQRLNQKRERRDEHAVCSLP